MCLAVLPVGCGKSHSLYMDILSPSLPPLALSIRCFPFLFREKRNCSVSQPTNEMHLRSSLQPIACLTAESESKSEGTKVMTAGRFV